MYITPRNRTNYQDSTVDSRFAAHSAHGPFSYLNPTHVYYHNNPSDKHQSLDFPLPEDTRYLWRSRDNRKGRHALSIHPTASDGTTKPQKTSTFRATLS